MNDLQSYFVDWICEDDLVYKKKKTTAEGKKEVIFNTDQFIIHA